MKLNSSKVAAIGGVALVSGLLLGGAGGARSVFASVRGVVSPTPAEFYEEVPHGERTPAEILDTLKEGNDRFASGRGRPRDWLSQAREHADQERPEAFVLACADSRVPVEVLFDANIGDMHVARVSGNFENTDILGSMEMGAEFGGAKLLVVLGHTSCGAIRGTIDGVGFGNVDATLQNIQPAVKNATRGVMTPTSRNAAFVNHAAEMNVWRTMSDIRARSRVLRDREDAGQLMIVGAIYDIETGVVRWLDGSMQ